MSKALIAFASANPRRPLYRRDVLNAVCYPDGWSLRLTYRAKWVQDGLERAIADDGLVGRRILLVFCGDPARVDFRLFVPIRFGRVFKSSTWRDKLEESDVGILRLELDERPNREFFARVVAGDPVLGPLPTLSGGHYLREVDGEVRHVGDPVPWSEQVKVLKRAPELANSRFVRIVAFEGRTDPRGRLRGPDVHRPELSDVSEVELQAGLAYDLTFEVPELTPEGNSLPEISIEGTHVETAEPVVHQSGRGAEISYLLTVQRKYASELATLVARVPSPGDGGKARPFGVQHPEGAPEFQVLLRISPARFFWPLTVAVLSVGLLFLNATPDVLASAGLTAERLESWGLPGAASMVGIVKAVGALAVAFMGAYSFRRLPVKI